jgi:hypothetical protein
VVVGAISGLCDYGSRFGERCRWEREWEWGLQRDTIATNKLSESCSCGHWPASRSRITRTHRFEPCLLPTENYLEPHCRPRQDVNRQRRLGLCFKSLCAPKTVEAPLHSHYQRTASQAKTLSPLFSRHAAGPEG